MTFSFWSSCLHFLKAGITDLRHIPWGQMQDFVLGKHSTSWASASQIVLDEWKWKHNKKGGWGPEIPWWIRGHTQLLQRNQVHFPASMLLTACLVHHWQGCKVGRPLAEPSTDFWKLGIEFPHDAATLVLGTHPRQMATTSHSVQICP